MGTNETPSSSFVQPTSSEISQETTSSESYGSSVVTTSEVPSLERSSIPSSSAETTSSESYGSSVVTTSEVLSLERSSIPSSSAVLTPSPLPRST